MGGSRVVVREVVARVDVFLQFKAEPVHSFMRPMHGP